MPKSTVLVGLKEADRAIKRLPVYVQGEAQIVATGTAVNVARIAAGLALRSKDGAHGHPPGFLASSIHWEASKGISAVVGVARAAFYWIFWEYGFTRFGRHYAARPMFRPAADAERQSHFTRMTAALVKAKERMLNG